MNYQKISEKIEAVRRFILDGESVKATALLNELKNLLYERKEN